MPSPCLCFLLLFNSPFFFRANRGFCLGCRRSSVGADDGEGQRGEGLGDAAALKNPGGLVIEGSTGFYEVFLLVEFPKGL